MKELVLMIRFLISLLSIVSFCFICSYARTNSESSILTDLVSVVVESDTTAENVPEIVADIVADYYAEATVPESVANNVLSFLSSAYLEHGYYDTGNWAKTLPQIRYVPYTGDLPEYNNSDFIIPVKGNLTSGFGYRPKFGRFHHGIDVALNWGDTVMSALPGIVTKSGYDLNGYGSYVVVSHAGGIETLYGHLLRILVEPGQSIKAGDAIALGGSTGNSTGPHLHFETRYRGVAIDPLSWFNISQGLKASTLR